MKTVKSVTGISLSIMLLATPHIAHAGEVKARDVVEFKLLASELESENGRSMVLSRMNQNARAACRNDSFTSNVVYKRSCRPELMEQWIAAIGNSSLSAQAYSRFVQIARAGN